MGVAGTISAWAWRKQAKLIRSNRKMITEKEDLKKHYLWKDML